MNPEKLYDTVLSALLQHLVRHFFQQNISRCAGMLFENWDIVESSFQASARRISPDKFDPFLQAYTHIAGFNSRLVNFSRPILI